jgi:thioredoxin 1
MTFRYDLLEPTRETIEHSAGPVVLEFGTDWCGYCQAAQPLIASVLARHPDVPHVKVADGKGRPLGRSFGVKRWPTLVFLRDGHEVMRTVRPTEAREIAEGLEAILH